MPLRLLVPLCLIVLACSGDKESPQAVEPFSDLQSVAALDQFIDATRGRFDTYFDDEVRHTDMTDPYDPALRQVLREAAAQTGVTVIDGGTYVCTNGPRFETPAEIRAIRTLGADAVGMSTVPEVILARFMGLRALAVSAITNMAAGMSDENIGHEHTKAMAPLGAAKLEQVLRRMLRDMG